ncbi:hypothetical protein LCM20_08880 [Halobacillus litoralis]|uniref:hypothetical protein n=1 Tax=Halobacillus litoralis TaxID=45668 RepID=UPI001CD23F81|nr:hypothetical protein [Halobacillus litoralis]MCA0970700.1 hypothetical protein [Halobacillus litoralis]
MKEKIEKWQMDVKEKFGLTDYTLGRSHFFRRITTDQLTQFTYTMEWFPSGIEHIDEDNNPDGTASIEVDAHTGELLSFIAVGGVLYADSIKLQNEQEVRSWVERELGISLSATELRRGDDGEYRFMNVVDGISTTPGADIRVRLDSEGRLLFFSQFGLLTTPEQVEEERFTLKLEDVKEIVMKQLKQIDYPIVEEKRNVSVFAIEEIYITNDGKMTIPFPLENLKAGIEKVMTYTPSPGEPFEGTGLNLSEEVTMEQAEKRESHPGLEPITSEQAAQAEAAVLRFLRTEYPEDSGKWTLKTLEREHGHLMALLKQNSEGTGLFEGKLKVMLSEDGEDVLNYLDSAVFQEITKEFTPALEPQYTKEQAFDRLKDHFELLPRYVLDQKTGIYKLCALLDCKLCVDAHTGEVISL